MAYFFCCLIVCLALFLVSLANRNFLSAHGKQGVFVKLDGEIIDWCSSPVLTFGGEGADVLVDPNCEERNVVVASVEAGQFYVQCSGEYAGFVERERDGKRLILKADEVRLQDFDWLWFRLPKTEQEQGYCFLVGDLTAAQIRKKMRGRG